MLCDQSTAKTLVNPGAALERWIELTAEKDFKKDAKGADL